MGGEKISQLLPHLSMGGWAWGSPTLLYEVDLSSASQQTHFRVSTQNLQLVLLLKRHVQVYSQISKVFTDLPLEILWRLAPAP